MNIPREISWGMFYFVQYVLYTLLRILLFHLGSEERWVKLEHFDVEWFHAYSKYPPGYGISVLNKPECINHIDNIDGTTPYRL